MRIHDDRYSRERRRFEVALHFIRFEARTRTIRVWTGLTDDRIRKLYRSYIRDPLCDARGRNAHLALPVRHRGKSPRQASFFTRSARARHESSSFASLCRITGALPSSPMSAAARDPASLVRGELLCQAYELYRARFDAPLLSFEHAEFLLRALCRGDELTLSGCRDCGALLVSDRWSLRAPRCIVCAPPGTGHRGCRNARSRAAWRT
jgi:hypothetical protein